MEEIIKTATGADNIETRESRALPRVTELRRALADSESSDIRKSLNALFDAETFCELGVYTKRSFSEFAATGSTNDLEGVICGYGAIEGRLVFAFGQDLSREGGAMDEKHAAKIIALYEKAIASGAPIVGIFNSRGASIYGGVSSLAAYGRIMRAVSDASGKIPQIAIITGDCTGCAAPLAAMFDFQIAIRGAEYHMHPSEFGGANEGNEALVASVARDVDSAMRDARILLSYLPSNANEGPRIDTPTDDINRPLGNVNFGEDVRNVVASIADHGVFEEITLGFAVEMFTAFTSIGGVRCGVIGNRHLGMPDKENESRIDAKAARKAARFVSFCDAFSIPLITLVDTNGFALCKDTAPFPYVSSVSSLAFAYAQSTMPKITVILGRAIGSAFTIFGSKSIGADVVYALDTAEIGPLATDASVALTWNGLISEQRTRKELENEWRVSLASPVAAAFHGEVDDIITVDELRKKILSAVYMLSAKNLNLPKRHPILPL